MKNEREKSDPSKVAERPANNPGQPGAESAEPREGTEGNTGEQHTYRTPSRESVSQGLERVREAAKQRKKERFTALLHHVTIDLLKDAYSWLKREAAPGVDGRTWQSYKENLEVNLRELHARIHQGSYQALPSRRRYIPKPDGRQRPLGIAALEDKIAQRAVVEVLNAIYETDFLGFSYGFRPGRGPHDALDALSVGIWRKKVNWVLDADIRDFFGQLDRAWLRKFLGHRIADKRVLRLIGRWLAAGVIEDGEWTECDQGSPQGSLCSAEHNHPSRPPFNPRSPGRRPSTGAALARAPGSEDVRASLAGSARSFVAACRRRCRGSAPGRGWRRARAPGRKRARGFASGGG